MVAVTKRRISCRRLAHPLLKQVSAPVRYRSTPRTQAASTTAFTRCECPQRVVDSTDIDATHYDPPRRKVWRNRPDKRREASEVLAPPSHTCRSDDNLPNFREVAATEILTVAAGSRTYLMELQTIPFSAQILLCKAVARNPYGLLAMGITKQPFRPTEGRVSWQFAED